MGLVRFLLWLNCALFLAFGLGFMVLPEPLAELVTGAAPETASAVTDMRATYGGLALGLAVVFGLCARNPDYLRLGMHGVLAVMLALAAGRLLGMAVDGAPNVFMFVLLAAEVGMAALVVFALRQQGDTRSTSNPN